MTTPENRLDETMRKLGQGSNGELSSLAEAARRELAQSPRARPWWLDALGLLAVNAVMAVGASAAMSWSTTQHASVMMRSLVAAAWLVVLAFGSVLWLKPGRAGPRWLVGGFFLIASGLAVFGASGWDPGQPFFAGLRCAFVECGVALLPLGVVLALSTRFAASPGQVFLGGLTAASAGAFALHLHCSNGTLQHLLVFHLAPALLLSGLAMGVHRVLKPRSFVP